MTLTPEQQAIVDADVPPSSALKVVAYAGTGKTSTLVSVAQKYPKDDILYLAFNKSVENEAIQRFPCNTTPKTGHALAYKHCGHRYRGRIGTLYSWQLKKAYGLTTYEASLLARSFESWANSGAEHPEDCHIEPDHLNKMSPHSYVSGMTERVEHLWDDLKSGRGNLPMPHSGYLKEFQLMKLDLGYPVVFLDEAQDTNPVMHDIVMRQADCGARIYLVGDPYQQIYSWRGAEDAMSKINAPELRLTQSFRFGPEIAALGSKVLKMFFNENNPLRGNDTVLDKITSLVGEPRTIIARTNAGLVNEAFACADKEESIFVVGETAFQEALVSINSVYALWKGQRTSITERRISMHKSFGDLCGYADETLDVELKSKIAIVLEHGTDWPDVCTAITNALKSEAEADVQLSTTHKAKGLEWNNVELSGDFGELFCTTPDPDEPTQIIVVPKTPVRHQPKDDTEIHAEEINLLYVALTRAKHQLAPNFELMKFNDYEIGHFGS